MVQELNSNDTTQISFIAELTENSSCSTSACVFEIDRICQVHTNGQGIHDDKNIFSHFLPTSRFLQMQREKHHYHIQSIGVHNGRSIKQTTSLQYFPYIPGSEISSQYTPIL